MSEDCTVAGATPDIYDQVQHPPDAKGPTSLWGTEQDPYLKYRQPGTPGHPALNRLIFHALSLAEAGCTIKFTGFVPILIGFLDLA